MGLFDWRNKQATKAISGLMGEDRRGEVDIVEWVDELRQQADSALDIGVDGTHSLRDWRARCGQIYMGGHWLTSPGMNLSLVVINKPQSAVLSQTAGQLEVDPKIEVEPVETSEPALYYLTPVGANKVMVAQARGLLQHFVLTEQDIAIIESVPDEGDPVQIPMGLGRDLQLLERAYVVPESGQRIPAILEPGDLITVDDNTASKELQRRLDKVLELSNFNHYVTEGWLMSNIFGDQALVFEVDLDEYLPKFTIPHYRAVWYDPMSTWVDNASYVGIDTLMSSYEAKRQFPKHVAAIENAESSGQLRQNYGWGSSNAGGHAYPHVNFTTPMVLVRTVWIKGHEIPMTPDEAMDSSDPDKRVVLDPEDQTTFILESTGETVVPGKGKWPRKRVLGQITTLPEAQAVVENIACPYRKYPITYFKNTPIPSNPHGMGEPARAWHVTEMINRVASIIMNLMKYNQYPEQVMPVSVYNALKKIARDIHSHPGRITPIEDSQWERYFSNGKNIGFNVEPNQVSPQMVDLLFRLIELDDKLRDHPEVSQGVPPSPTSSGEQLKVLQAASRGTAGLKAKYLELGLKWIGYLVLDFVTGDWFPDKEWDKYGSQYSGAVREAFRTRAKRLKYDVKVSVAMGSGSTKAMRDEKSLGLYDRGAIGPERLLEDLEYPNVTQALREVEERAAASQSVQPEGPSNNQS